MDYKVLYRKYRPKTFSDLVGQDHIRELLLNSIISNRISHAYLFTGPRGTGKTSAAKIFAKTVNCEQNKDGIPCDKCVPCKSYNDTTDIIEIDAASNNGVDEIRELRDNVKILPTISKYKVYIVDEVHMLSSSAWNAFLKTLEEPPQHVIFILATTEIQKVPITVLSRCQRFDFQKISSDVIEERINSVAKQEKIKITSEAVAEIALLADGAMRDALSLLDQLSKLEVKIDLGVINEAYGILTNKELEALLTALNEGNVQNLVDFVAKIQKNGVDSAVLLTKLLDFLLLEAINSKMNKEKKYPNIKNIEDIIIELEKCYNRSNQYILLKSVLLKNIGCEEKTWEIPIKPEKEEKTEIKEKPKNISREIISQTETKDPNEELIRVRINNSYVDANLNLKKEFVDIWKKFGKKIIDNNDMKLMSLINDSVVEVVSPTNCILSTDFYSNSVLFNSLLQDIEEKLFQDFEYSIKLICLDKETWTNEKAEYMKNRKTKEYELIQEPELIIKNEVVNSAEDLFGDELIEVN